LDVLGSLFGVHRSPNVEPTTSTLNREATREQEPGTWNLER